MNKDLWVGHFQCQKCGMQSDHHLFTMDAYMLVLCFSVFVKNEKRGILCDYCGGYRELSKEDYKQIRADQLQKMRMNEFPDEVILRDFAPYEIHWVKRVFWFIVACFVAITMLFTTIRMFSEIEETDASVFIGGLFMLLIGFGPLILAVKKLIAAKEKRTLYKDVMKKRKA